MSWNGLSSNYAFRDDATRVELANVPVGTMEAAYAIVVVEDADLLAESNIRIDAQFKYAVEAYKDREISECDLIVANCKKIEQDGIVNVMILARVACLFAWALHRGLIVRAA